MKQRLHESGMVLILSFIIVLFVSTMGLSLMQAVAAQYGSYKQRVYAENAISAAEAGVSASIAQLNLNSSFTGFATEQEMYSTTDRGRAAYTTTITTDANQNKIIVSTGKTYKTPNTSNLANTKQIRAVATEKRDRITNSLIFGSGGVYLSQGAGFPQQGNVYIRGQLQMEQNAFVGTSTLPVNLTMANLGCDTGHNWPQPCGAASPPITMVNPTPGKIYGTVCAQDQVSTTGIVPTSGLTPNCRPQASAAPTFNKKAFIQGMSATGTDPSTFACPFFGGTVTIPAGTRISGDLTVGGGFGNCIVYVAGDIYITGALTVLGGGIMQAADSLGTTRPTVVVNQGITLTVTGSTTLFQKNSSGTPLFIITFGSTNTTCSADETTPSDTVQTCLTPDQAKASAISGPYPGSVFATVNMSGAIFYSYYGGLSMSANVILQFYALGTQGAWLGANTQVTTIADDSPFGNILYFPTYRLIEYQQL